MKKVKCFTHNDLDGFGSNIIFKYLENENNSELKADVINCNYDNINNNVMEYFNNKEYKNYDVTYITDISITDDNAKIIDNIIKEENIKVLLFDHHKTAKHLSKYDWCDVKEEIRNRGEMEKISGSWMLYNHLHINGCFDNINSFGLDNIIDNIRKYDTWLWKTKYNDKRPKLLNDLFELFGYEMFLGEILDLLNTYNNHGDFINYVLYKNSIILQVQQNKIDRYIKGKNKNIIIKSIQDYNVGIVFAEQYISELGNKLCELNKDLDLVAIIGNNSVSYRTIKDDVDVSKIAKIYEGGGHPKSSGNKISEETINNFINNIFYLK